MIYLDSKKWKDFDGIMCDPVTEEQMADKTSKGRPAQSVGGPYGCKTC